MAANKDPIFTLTPITTVAQISVANTGRDGTGTLVTCFTGGTNGSRLNKIVIQASGTTTAGMVRLFIGNGSVTWLWKEVAVTAITPSGTVQAFRQVLSGDPIDPTNILVAEEALPLFLPATYTVKAAPHNAETFNVTAFGGDY